MLGDSGALLGAADVLMAVHATCFLWTVPQKTAGMSRENEREVIFWECARVGVGIIRVVRLNGGRGETNAGFVNPAKIF